MKSQARDVFFNYKGINDFENNTHISIKSNYVFIQISKAASSSVKWVLQYLEFYGSPWNVVDVNNKFYAPHISPYQITDSELDKAFFGKEYKRVTFVRNPLTRLLSCYLHRIVGNPRSASNKALIKATGGKGGSDISFNEFIEVICSQSSIEQESHWRCQYDDLAAEVIDYDFVGRVESIDTDINEMVRVLYGDSGLKRLGKVKKKDASPMVTKSNEKVKEYYKDNYIKDLVLQRFENDFERFGYKNEL